MLVGLSLSFCVKDIIEGKVKEDEVLFIVSGTSFEDDVHFREGMERYASYYWSMSPQEGIDIATRLWKAEKIHQPRVDNSRDSLFTAMPLWHSRIFCQGIHWMQIWRP